MKELKLVLEGLDCANCASKIEAKVGQLDDVQESSLNFMNKILTVEHNYADENTIFEKINKIVKSMEPHVIVSKIEEDECEFEEQEEIKGCSCCTHDDTRA